MERRDWTEYIMLKMWVRVVDMLLDKTGRVRDYLDKSVSVEQRNDDCDALAGHGEEGLDRGHHAKDVGGGHTAGKCHLL